MVTVKPHHSIINVTARKVMICKMNIRQWHIKFKIFLRKCTDKEKQPLIILGAFITLTFLFVINSSLRRETVEETRMMCKPKSLLEGTEIRNRSSAKSKDSKHVLQISNAFDHMLKWKDPCMVWFDLRSRLMLKPVTWWQNVCEMVSDWLTTDYNCTDVRRMGNWRVCFDFSLIPKKSCLVYSFGIDYDFKFDDAMAEQGCTVYSFDPSMNTKDYQRSETVFFKNIGIAGLDSDTFVPRIDQYVTNRTTWRVRRLSSIMKELGHKPGSISILKMDIESYEWDVLADLVDSNLLATIPQLLVEWHVFPDSPPHSQFEFMLDDYCRLKHLGFRKFWNPDYLWSKYYLKRYTAQAENSFVNIHFMSWSLIR